MFYCVVVDNNKSLTSVSFTKERLLQASTHTKQKIIVNES